MMLLEFQERVERYLDCKLECVITRNRSTMLNLLEKSSARVKLSLHEMFLSAPEDVIVAIAAYVKQVRKERHVHNRRLKEYINAHYGDYHHERKLPALVMKGRVYDLELLMAEINAEYFGGSLELAITWFKGRGGRRRILFGKYEESMRLVKISDRLDDPFVPRYFVSYVIYHEMVHSVVTSYVDGKGRCRMHGPEFKSVERRFSEYAKAREWERGNKERFFGRA